MRGRRFPDDRMRVAAKGVAACTGHPGLQRHPPNTTKYTLAHIDRIVRRVLDVGSHVLASGSDHEQHRDPRAKPAGHAQSQRCNTVRTGPSIDGNEEVLKQGKGPVGGRHVHGALVTLDPH